MSPGNKTYMLTTVILSAVFHSCIMWYIPDLRHASFPEQKLRSYPYRKTDQFRKIGTSMQFTYKKNLFLICKTCHCGLYFQ